MNSTNLLLVACLAFVGGCNRTPSTDDGAEVDAGADADDSSSTDADLVWWTGSYTRINLQGGGQKQAARYTLNEDGTLTFTIEDCADLISVQKVGRWELSGDGSAVELLNEAGTAPFSMSPGIEDGDTQWYLRRTEVDGECTAHLEDMGEAGETYQLGALCLAEDSLDCLDDDMAVATSWCDGEEPAPKTCP